VKVPGREEYQSAAPRSGGCATKARLAVVLRRRQLMRGQNTASPPWPLESNPVTIRTVPRQVVIEHGIGEAGSAKSPPIRRVASWPRTSGSPRCSRSGAAWRRPGRQRGGNLRPVRQAAVGSLAGRIDDPRFEVNGPVRGPEGGETSNSIWYWHRSTTIRLPSSVIGGERFMKTSRDRPQAGTRRDRSYG